MLQQGVLLDGRYVVEARLGQGGMAAVWRVRHATLGTLHALKVLQVATPHVRDALLREGKIQGSLRHPNVVGVSDVVSVDGMPGLVLELVEGPTLADLLADRRLTVEEADALARGVLDGAAAAHAAGMVHRDLKPGNVLLALGPRAPIPKIADFGLAKILRAEPSATATRSGVTMGTPAYMAPEQIRDARSVDARADVFGLGAILFELVTGRRAFEGADTFSVFENVVHGRRPSVAELAPGLPDRMARAIEAALRGDPADRPADAGALLAAWTADGTASAPVLDDALIEDARRLAEQRRTDAPGSTYGAHESTSTATGPAPEERAPAPPAPPASARGGRALAGVALAAALLVAGAGAWWASRAAEDGDGLFTAGDAPESTTPERSARLDEAWALALRGDLTAAERLTGELVAEDPADPAPLLLDATARWLLGEPVALTDGCSKVERVATPGEPARDLALAWLHPDRDAELRAWIDAHPGDLLAPTWLTFAGAASAGPELESLEPRLAAHPDAGLLWMARARLLGDDLDAAVAALDAGLAAGAEGSWLRFERARRLRDPERRRAELEAVVAADPTLWRATGALYEEALRSGRTDDARRWAEAAMADAVPVAKRIRFASFAAFSSLAVGRSSEAAAHAARATQLSRSSGRTTDEVEGLLLEYTLAELVRPEPDPRDALVERMQKVGNAPEISERRRDHLLSGLLALEGERAALAGDLPAAKEAERRLTALGSEFASRISFVLDAAGGALGPDSCAAPEVVCMSSCVVAITLEVVGRVEDARTCLSHLDAAGSCEDTGIDRYCAGEAAVAGAERAWAEGDAARAGARLEAWRALWPDPDPALPSVVRARELERALGG